MIYIYIYIPSHWPIDISRLSSFVILFQNVYFQNVFLSTSLWSMGQCCSMAYLTGSSTALFIKLIFPSIQYSVSAVLFNSTFLNSVFISIFFLWNTCAGFVILEYFLFHTWRHFVFDNISLVFAIVLITFVWQLRFF